jgi:hypothetical protein
MPWLTAPLIQGWSIRPAIHLALSLAGFFLWGSAGLLLCFGVLENVSIVMGWKSGTRKKKSSPRLTRSFLSTRPTNFEVLPALECRVDAAHKRDVVGERGTDLYL